MENKQKKLFIGFVGTPLTGFLLVLIVEALQIITFTNGLTSGNLTLINSANITTRGLNITQSGDKVFINAGSELRIT